VSVTDSGGTSNYLEFKVIPTISGPDTVWWFSGQSPSGYATQITLTSLGGNATWTATAGASEVSLSATSGASINVTSSGTAFSGSVGDVQLKATVSGVDSAPFSLTTRRPFRLVQGNVTFQCDSQFGYNDSLAYTIQDNLLANMPLSLPINEHWTSDPIADFAGTNWRQNPAGSYTTAPSAPASFADNIGGENLALPPNPVPNCGTTGQNVIHWGQEWKVGSTQIGVGTRVQTDTLQKATQHAEHDNILTGSGVQP
jgi:hypothetical protein